MLKELLAKQWTLMHLQEIPSRSGRIKQRGLRTLKGEYVLRGLTFCSLLYVILPSPYSVYGPVYCVVRGRSSYRLERNQIL